MTLTLISTGLAEKEDMSIKAVQTAQECDILYLETYTSKGDNVETLEKFLKKKIIPLERKNLEDESGKIIKEAKEKKVGVLIYGHALSATTHTALLYEAKEKKVKSEVIHGSSILTAVSVSGLSLYNFGKTISIPFHNEHVQEPYNVLLSNLSQGAHTLLLLDLAQENYMSANEGLSYLIKLEGIRKEKILSKKTLAIICAALGTKQEKIIAGSIEELLKKKINAYPQVIIIPGKMQFYEEEFLENYKI